MAQPGCSRSSAWSDRVPRVLIVEDEPLLLKAMARSLQDLAEVRSATTVADALLALAAGESFSLVLCDVGLPDGSGLDVLEAIRDFRPTLLRRTVLLSGKRLGSQVAREVRECGGRLLVKPLDSAQLRALVQDEAVTSE